MKINRQTIRDFEEEWCAKEPPQQVIRPQGNDDEFRKQIRQGPTVPDTVLSIEGLTIQHQDLISDATKKFGIIRLGGDNKSEIEIRNATIWMLEVYAVGKEVRLENCRIGRLVVHNTANLQIKNCMISWFTVPAHSHIQNLDWDGGYLGQFDLVQDIKKAFVGDVSFHRHPRLPTTDKPPHGVQWLRDTREALNARNNFVAAGIFHASELKLTRPKGWQRKIRSAYWWTSWGYQLGSDFGNSIGLPFLWLIGMFLSIGVLALRVGTEPSHETSVTWLSALDGRSAKIAEALIYAGQSIFNPLNFFVSKPLISVSHWMGALAGFVLGIIGIIAFALLLLSVRRRFKLE